MEQNKTLTANNPTNEKKTITVNSNGVVQESVKQKSFSLDKSSLLIIVLLFMFSSKLWDIAWDIGKSLLYIIIIMYLISFVNQDLADNIKNIIHDFTNVNSSNNFVTDLIGKISGKVKNLLKIGQVSDIGNVVQGYSKPSTQAPVEETVKPKQQTQPSQVQPTEKFTSVSNPNFYDGISNLSSCNTKNLSNSSRSSSKNIFV
jgi:hypothetical protein